LSYLELDESSTALAQWFLAQGLQPGDRVALHWSNSIEVVQLFFAVFKAGLVAVTVNTRLKPAEICYILEHSQARICFSEPTLAGLAEQSGAACSIRSALPPLPPTQARPAASPVLDPDKPALILYTSGTTARPKAVTHSHRSLFSTAAVLPKKK
jgi:long-chain acyl-CoA synthetase